MTRGKAAIRSDHASDLQIYHLDHPCTRNYSSTLDGPSVFILRGASRYVTVRQPCGGENWSRQRVHIMPLTCGFKSG